MFKAYERKFKACERTFKGCERTFKDCEYKIERKEKKKTKPLRRIYLVVTKKNGVSIERKKNLLKSDYTHNSRFTLFLFVICIIFAK